MISEDLGRFWHRALGLDPRTVAPGGLAVSASGRYRDATKGRSVLLFTHLAGNERILVADAGILPRLDTRALKNLDLDGARTWSPGEGFSLEYDDIDHFVGQSVPPRPAADIRVLSTPQDPGVAAFWGESTEDDLDTLDVTFEGESAYGLYEGGRLTGVSRFVNIGQTNVSDITVLVGQAHRGRNAASTLAAHVIHEILASGRTPKYRAGAANPASRRVAFKLGLVPEFSLLTWTKNGN